ncbi:DUF2142 domain-containing protein [Agromyces aerolatus]|uniref:DUF2142 domain-containing protein n=1 Tax=Agromyces sp. LY-1074 TaxID=3074080 RepID=UPI00285BF13A|nr:MULTISPECIES: DUF2142 domain-containing protein [unclassified Agromyces]MDR5700373.1 DUF2142 domain-containing protein [Agromyces sp. LY-1074]MDR5706649.1 DUF2142 domain-containing protein [Agromyces sp. LY-1358]
MTGRAARPARRPRPARPARPARPWWYAALLGFAGMALVSISWALLAPPVSGPDEASHLIRAETVVHGHLVLDGLDSRGFPVAPVSPGGGQLWAQICYLLDPSLSAACAPGLSEATEPTTLAATGAGRYNPVYYAAVGWPSLLMSGDGAVLAMRVVSALLNSAFIGLAFGAIAQLRRRSAAALGLFVGLTPMVGYLVSIVNPNSVEITAAAALFAWLTLLVLQPSRRAMPLRAGVILVSALMVLSARAITPLWALLIIIAALLLPDRARWSVLVRSAWTWAALAVGAVLSAGAIAWVVIVAPLTPTAPYPGVGDDFTTAFTTMLIRTMEYGRDLFGQFLTLRPPDALVLALAAGTLAIIASALVQGRGRARITTAFLALSILLAPAFVQGVSAFEHGYIWQGRYVLALLPPLLIAAGLAIRSGTLVRQARIWTTVFAVLSAAAIVAGQIIVFGRVAVGTDRPWWQAFANPEWTPPIPAIACFVIASAGVALLAFASVTASARVPADTRRADTTRADTTRAAGVSRPGGGVERESL